MERLNVKAYIESEYDKIRNSRKFSGNKDFSIFQVGNNPASNKYVGNKIKKCEELGINVSLNKVMSSDVEYINSTIISNYRSNRRKCMVQFPVPHGVKTEFIDKCDDVDGLTDENQSLLFSENVKNDIEKGKFFNIACTARGVAEYMSHIDENLSGKTVVIIGRSILVGKPLARLLSLKDMTVIQTHSKTPKKVLLELVKTADYVVTAVGKIGVITSEDIPAGCTVIDVGINFNEDGKLVGDFVILDSDLDKDFRFTPVPGGVGLLTVQSLIKNILEIPIYAK